MTSSDENFDRDSVSNDEVISKISHKETKWTQDSILHLRRLILKTVIELCNAAIRNRDLSVSHPHH